MHTECHQLDLERRGQGFSKFEEPNTGGRLGIDQESDAFDLGRDLFEQLQPFSAHRHVPVCEPREVAVGTRLVVDKTGTDRIADACKNNRQSADFRLNNLRHQISVGDQHVRCQADQFHKDGACSTGIRAGKTNINADIAAIVPTQLLQFLPQRHDLSLCRRIGLGIPHEDADAPHPLALLRARRERPRCRAAECGQQFPPSDGDCHTPLPCEVRKGTVPRHERPVFTFKEGRMLVASASFVSFNCTTPAASFLRMPPSRPRASRHSASPYSITSSAGATAKRCHSPGTPLRACMPRSSNAMPEPTTRSFTVLETSTSPGFAVAATRLPICTAMPSTLLSSTWHSPL